MNVIMILPADAKLGSPIWLPSESAASPWQQVGTSCVAHRHQLRRKSRVCFFNSRRLSRICDTTCSFTLPWQEAMCCEYGQISTVERPHAKMTGVVLARRRTRTLPGRNTDRDSPVAGEPQADWRRTRRPPACRPSPPLHPQGAQHSGIRQYHVASHADHYYYHAAAFAGSFGRVAKVRKRNTGMHVQVVTAAVPKLL